MEYSEEMIEHFLKEKKKISSPQRKDFKMIGQHFKNEFNLVSLDGQRSYRVFIRKHGTTTNIVEEVINKKYFRNNQN